VVATVTLAAYINLGGLGYDILQGIPLRRDEQVVGAAVVVIVIALLLDAMFGALTHLVDRVIPAAAPRPRKLRDLPLRQVVVVGSPTGS
jgi:osmoprotectant transport system permease protein